MVPKMKMRVWKMRLKALVKRSVLLEAFMQTEDLSSSYDQLGL